MTPLDDYESDSDKVIYLGDDKPITIKPTMRSRGPSESKNKSKKEPKPQKIEEPSQQSNVKRGQKGKLKKIKEKYRDQDDEERQLRMQILQSSGKLKDSKKSKKKQEQILNIEKQAKKIARAQKPVIRNEDDEDNEELQVATEVDMLDSLTGIPHTEDELLFSVPVVAPYNTLTNYK